MKRVSFIVLALIVILTTNLIAQDKSKSTTPKFDPARDPFKDLKEVIVDAQSTGKRILLDVGGEWCIWCHRLDGFLDAHPELKNFMHDNFCSAQSELESGKQEREISFSVSQSCRVSSHIYFRK